MPRDFLTVLPVFNEDRYVASVLKEVLRYSRKVLVVDDGSTDATPRRLADFPEVQVLRHSENQGYGAALKSAFDFATARDYDVVVTIDCDGQHEPQRIPQFVAKTAEADIVSGSRYLGRFPSDTAPPEDRRRINRQVTAELNRRLGLRLTDAFCGFKAYRVDALRKLHLSEPGYSMPLELWVQAAAAGLLIVELPVPLVYLDLERSFGGAMDDAATRLECYHLVLDRSLAAVALPNGVLWSGTLAGEVAG